MIGRLNHVAIVVPDLDAAARLYRESLGAVVSQPVPLPDHGVHHGVRGIGEQQDRVAAFRWERILR